MKYIGFKHQRENKQNSDNKFYLQIGHFPFATHKVWIIELTLIHKNIRSVHNSQAQELILILKLIGKCDVTDEKKNASFEDLNIHYH